MDEIKYKGEWLQIKAARYIDSEGDSHCWEYLSRNDSNSSVCVVPLIRKADAPDKIILLKQFRPAINKHILGLPSGRVMQNEDVATAGLRELREETGYEARILRICQPFYPSPETSCEKVNVVIAEVGDCHRKIDNKIEVASLEIMEISALFDHFKHQHEICFDMRVLSIFFYLQD